MPTHYFQEPKLVPDAVERAKKGDRDASRDLLEAFADFADAKKPAPAALVDYIAEASREYLDADTGKSLEKCLNLTRPRNREKTGASSEKLREAAIYEIERRKAERQKRAPRKMDEGKTRVNEGALLQAARKVPKSSDTIRRTINELGRYVELLSDQELSALSERTPRDQAFS